MPITVGTISPAKLAILNNVYHTQRFFFGRDKLYHHLKENHPTAGISIREVMAFLRAQTNYQRNLPPVQTKHFRPIISQRPLESLQIDLQDFTNKPSYGYRYVLIVIDVFSRFVWARPIKEKTAKAVKVAFAAIFNSITDKDTIRLIMSDDGGEFKGELKTFIKGQGIKYIQRAIPQANGIVERSNKTTKGILYKIVQSLSPNQPQGWNLYLQEAISKYNNSLHREIGMTPEQAINLDDDEIEELFISSSDRRIEKAEKRKKESNVMTDVLNVGDMVRLQEKKGPLGKTFINNYSKEIYTIGKVIKPSNSLGVHKYRIIDNADNRGRVGFFYREQLLRI